MPNPGHSLRPQRWFLLGCLFEAGLGLLAISLGYLFQRQPLAHLHWETRAAGAGVIATFPLLAAFIWLLRSHRPWAQRITRFLEDVVRPLLAPATVLELAVLATLAGMGEELLFRGLLQPGLAGLTGPVPALLMVSVLFGAAHWITPAYAIIAGIIGLYLGLLWMGSGNLLLPIVTHALYDFLALLYFLRWRAGAGSAAVRNLG